MPIQLLVQLKNAGDAADVVGELLGFVAGEGAAEEGGLAVAEPLLEDLVTAEGVGPDGFGDIFPTGGGVEVDIEEALERLPEVTFPGPGMVTPPCPA